MEVTHPRGVSRGPSLRVSRTKEIVKSEESRRVVDDYLTRTARKAFPYASVTVLHQPDGSKDYSSRYQSRSRSDSEPCLDRRARYSVDSFERGSRSGDSVHVSQPAGAPARPSALRGPASISPRAWSPWSRESPRTAKAASFPFSALPQLEALLIDQRARTSGLERADGRIIAPVSTGRGNASFLTRRRGPPPVRRRAYLVDSCTTSAAPLFAT